MVKLERFVVLVGVLLLPTLAMAQDRYAVHYKYKPQSQYSLELPGEFMLEKALGRRIKERVELDSTDLPVSPKYVETVLPLVEKVHYHSKWLNASIVVATEDQIKEISKLPFVQYTELVGRGFYSQVLDGKKESMRIPVSFRTKSKKADAYDFQNDLLGIPQMHEEGYTGAGVTIAVFDAGFINTDKISGMKHLFEQGQILSTRDFVLPGSTDVFKVDAHGTASLSVMASYEPGKLVAGAFDSQYILCITEDVNSEYKIEEYNWVRAAEFSDSLGVDIINSSLGYNRFDDPAMNYQLEDLDGKTAVITRGASMAAKKGILVVSSAGNEGNGSWKTITAPADGEGILAIGSVNNNLEKSGFSSTGPTADGRIKPDLVAFGSGVVVWRQVDNPNTSSGTSFTSPQVAALAAGLWQARPDWTKQELIERLLASATLADEPNSELGYGIPNFRDAYYGEILDLEQEESKSYVFPNPLDGNELFIYYGKEKECGFRLISPQGQILADHSLSRNSLHSPYQLTLKNTLPGLYIVECQESGDRKRFSLVLK
ncbi:MAG TPA: S8 family serine peptidase [Cyclobacteriaceae bacterium]|nr:S8 family serine peptidase [Cyclobacteriaceae bacterium]